MAEKQRKTILIAVSGSIAAYKACDVVSALRKEGHTTLCLMTKSAEQFITPLSLKSVSGQPVYRDPFEHPELHLPVHTSLADKADLVVFVPASATAVNRSPDYTYSHVSRIPKDHIRASHSLKHHTGLVTNTSHSNTSLHRTCIHSNKKFIHFFCKVSSMLSLCTTEVCRFTVSTTAG